MRRFAWVIVYLGLLGGCAQIDSRLLGGSESGRPLGFAQVSAIPAVSNLYGRAQEQWQAGAIDQAETSLERALRLEPANGYLWLGLAQLAKEGYAFERARELGFRARSFTAGDDRLKKAVAAFLATLEP